MYKEIQKRGANDSMAFIHPSGDDSIIGSAFDYKLYRGH
jgi:hypothetical protein